MPNLSKYFYLAVKNKTCADFTHPNLTCWQSARELAVSAWIGAMKFYFPGCFIPLLFKIEKWHTIKFWKDFLVQYFKCILIGYFLSFGSINIFCLFYHIFRRFHFPTFVFLPSALGCSFCMFLPDKMQHIDSIGLLALLFESLIKYSANSAVQFLRQSRNFATLMFMCFNAATMFGLQMIKHKRFWFTSLPARKSNVLKIPDDEAIKQCQSKFCNHEGACIDYNCSILKKSLGISCALVSLKNVIPVGKLLIKGQPMLALTFFFKRLNYGAIAFLTTNTVFFNTILCAINNRRKINSLDEHKVAIAGLLAGFSYYFYPNYLVFGFGMITTIELLWQSYMVSSLHKPRAVILFNKLPFKVLMYILTVGSAFQMRVVYPHSTNKFVHTLMSYGTGGRMDLVTENFAGMMMGLQ